MEPRVEKISPRAGLEPGNAGSVGQRLTTELPGHLSGTRRSGTLAGNIIT